jgi:hypothetical protein
LAREQVAGNSEQSEVAELVEVSEQGEVTELVEVNQAEAAAEEEKSSAEYVESFALDEPEPELRPTEIVMETLRPAGVVAPSEPASPVKPRSPASPEQQTAPTVRESWRQLPTPAASQKEELTKEDTLATIQEPVVEEPPEERILLPDYPIMFSRVARVTVGQLVEIPFRGRDWVFLGEVGARRGIAYDSRKMEPEGESFVFRVEEAGVYALKFYRQDFVRDLIFNDHVRIIAGAASETTGLGWFNPPTDRSRVVVGPRWPNSLEHPQGIDLAEGKEIAPAVPPAVVQPPAAEQPPAAPPATTQPPAVVQPPASTQPPAAARPPAATQPPARQPARNETRPQSPSADTAAQNNPAQPPSSSTPKETTAPKEATAPEPVSPDSIMKQAREEFNAGRIAAAITLLDQFCKSFPSGSDEAWWLYGQCFEANSPNRNMLSALEYYRRLVREYPMSSRLNDARRRIAYLERYYINIQ